MQFEYQHKVGQKFASVVFNSNITKYLVIESFELSFSRVGGRYIPEFNKWLFPTYINAETITKIIHNTCFVCGGLMQDGEALQNTLVSFDDFGNDAGQRGTTQSRVGEPKILLVRKCSSCGHSHT